MDRGLKLLHPQRTLWTEGDRVWTIDQTRLPFEAIPLSLTDVQGCAHAIATLQVRGAPLIGAVAAFGLALALREEPTDRALDRAFHALAQTRPTAVNLRWALERVRQQVQALPAQDRAVRAWGEAVRIADEDVAVNAALGMHGAALLQTVIAERAQRGRPVGRDAPLYVLTHCNAGRLATVAHGTALAPLYRLHQAGVPLQVWVDETRPRNQGASLTAWELREAGIPCTVIADNAGAELMRLGRVDAVLVGCDRVARNGDVANKVGTALKAFAARYYGIPFWVACPLSTLDAGLQSGAAMPIEYRSPREVTHIPGRDAQGRWSEVQLVPDGIDALNPAFDVTPADCVTGLITEHGLCAADTVALSALLQRVQPRALQSHPDNLETPHGT